MGKILEDVYKENEMEIARRMLRSGGLDIETIAAVSGLSVDEVEELIKEEEDN